jgi:nuclear pore complex protein Nup160
LNAGLPQYYLHILSLFDKDKAYSYVIDFARLALQFAPTTSKDVETIQLRTEVLSRMFNAAMQTSRYDVAYSSMALLTDRALQHSLVRALVTRMCQASCASHLIELPFLGLQDLVDDILVQQCQAVIDVNSGVPYHKILYAWRIRRNDFRGAASVSLERLKRLQQAAEGDKVISGLEDHETPVTREYLGLINALSCVDPKQAWILSDGVPSKPAAGQKSSSLIPKRRVVTLENVRKEYQEELDRLAAIENNQFAFTGGDEMDVL